MPSNHGDIRAGDWISSSVCTNRKPWQTGITDRSFWSVLLDLLISSISCNFAMGLQGHEINSCLKQDDLQCSKHVSLSLQCSKYPCPWTVHHANEYQLLVDRCLSGFWGILRMLRFFGCGHRILTCLPVTSGQWWNPLLFYKPHCH